MILMISMRHERAGATYRQDKGPMNGLSISVMPFEMRYFHASTTGPNSVRCSCFFRRTAAFARSRP